MKDEAKPEKVFEVKRGELRVDGAALPVRKGLLYQALARAGWRGADGTLPSALVQRLLRIEKRLSLLL